MSLLLRLKETSSEFNNMKTKRRALITAAIRSGNYSEREIARAAGISGPAIHYYKKKIEEHDG